MDIQKRAFIIGITGQDGAHLAEFLLEKGYKVYGGYRRISTPNFWRLEELNIKDKIELIECDLLDMGSLITALRLSKPTEVYNLGAQSFVAVSFKEPLLTSEITGLGVTRILEAIRIVDPYIRFYNASSSEMYGKVQEVPQTEDTPFYPRSPYGVAKLYGYWITKNYRESYGMFACSGILFNHCGEFRGKEFVTRKITSHVAKVAAGENITLQVGNLNSKRDWGSAKEYVEGMWKMLQQAIPRDFVLATGEAFSVRDLIELAFKVINIEIKWKYNGLNEKGFCKKTNKLLVEVNKDYYRPAEVDLLLGDATKAKKELNWERKISFEQLIEKMVLKDIERLNQNKNNCECGGKCNNG